MPSAQQSQVAQRQGPRELQKRVPLALDQGQRQLQKRVPSAQQSEVAQSSHQQGPRELQKRAPSQAASHDLGWLQAVRRGNSRSGWGRHSSHRWHRAHTSRDHRNFRSGCRRHSSHRWHRGRDHGNSRSGCRRHWTRDHGNSKSGWGRHSSHRWHRAHTGLVGRQWSRDHGNSRSGCRRHSSHRWHRAHTSLVGRQWSRDHGNSRSGCHRGAVDQGPSQELQKVGSAQHSQGGTELTPAWLAPGTAVATPEVGAVGGTGGLAEAGRPCTLASLQDASSGFSDPWPCMARLQQIQRSTALPQLSTSDYIYS